MNRKETSNTFSQGVVNDLDPMNVPNTVLTDSLNGTIITYDGNEMSLQNDMGNYGLKNGKLKEGYIPVGMQEYGDILYVVSYNPIENKAEVGSLPSPNYIASPTSKQADSEEITSILDGLTGESDYYYDDESDLDEFEDEGENIDDLEPPSIKYTDIIERSKLKVFGNYSDDFLLNPGDYYKIEEGSFIKSKYESIDYYLIDTDRKVHDDLQINNDGSSFISPSWEMPGWIGYKQNYAEIDDFKVNVRKAHISQYAESINITLNYQIFVTDEKLINSDDLRVYIKYNVKNNTTVVDHIQLTDFVLNNDGSKTFYADWSVEVNKDDLEENQEIFTITSTPFLYDSSESVQEYIKYDNLVVKNEFNIIGTVDVSDINFGENYYKYSVNQSNNDSLILTFDTCGIEEGSVFTDDVKLTYDLTRIYDNPNYVIDSSGNEYRDIEIENWNIYGDNTTITLNFEDFNSTSWNNGDPKKLLKEDFYIITFKLWVSEEESPIKRVSRLIVASELMNDFSVEDNYSTVTFDRWMGRYTYHISNPSIEISNVDYSQQEVSGVYGNSDYTVWSNGRNSLNMSKYNYFSSNMPSTIKTECDIDINLTYDYNSQSKLLYGPIWYYFLNGSSQKKGSDTSSFNLYTGESTLAKSGNIDTTQIKNYRIYPTNGCSSNILSGSNYTSTDCSFYNNQVLNAYYNNETNRLIINNIPYSSDDLNHQPIENMMRELSDSLYNEVIGFGLNISGNETVNVGTDDVYNTTNERNWLVLKGVSSEVSGDEGTLFLKDYSITPSNIKWIVPGSITATGNFFKAGYPTSDDEHYNKKSIQVDVDFCNTLMYNNQDIFTITGRNNINPNIVDNNNLEYSSNYSISNIGNSTYVLTDNDYDNIYTSKATEIGSKFASFNDDRILNINNQIQNQYNMFSLDDAMNMESPGYITYEILNPAYEQISGLLNHGTEYGFTKDGNYFIFPQGYTSYNFYLGDRVTYTGEIEDPESQA